MLEVKAPANIKLFGEHAVVYGRLAVATAVDLFARAKSKASGSSALRLVLNDFKASYDFSEEQLTYIYSRYKNKRNINDYIHGNASIPQLMLPFGTIAARLMKEHGMDVLGKEVSIDSEIPIQAGLGSSSAFSTSFTTLLVKESGNGMERDEIVDVARDGDRILHRNDGAGMIDVNASFYGGYVSYKKDKGVSVEDVKGSMNIMIVNTGPKRSTAETVGSVTELHSKRKAYTEKIFDEIEGCSMRGLEALKSMDLNVLGRCMFKDQEMLVKLGVSSPGLDRLVEMAKKEKALGAKLSGGGGGGIGFVLLDKKNQRLADMLKAEGFTVYNSKTGAEGAVEYF
ncbi:MAG: mevalonate kinase [Candidatus Micrarchaeota archaeon]|nr:mevalonate kinase [Candidatus Micrarchaeota archaeon]